MSQSTPINQIRRGDPLTAPSLDNINSQFNSPNSVAFLFSIIKLEPDRMLSVTSGSTYSFRIRIKL